MYLKLYLRPYETTDEDKSLEAISWNTIRGEKL